MCHLHFTIHPSKYLLSIYHLPGPSLSIHKVKWRPYFWGVYNAVLKIRPIHHYQFMCHGQSSKAQWLKPPVLGPDSWELGSGPGTPALFLEGGAVIAVTVLGTTRLGWSAVGVWRSGLHECGVDAATHERGAHTKCCRFPSRDRFTSLRGSRKASWRTWHSSLAWRREWLWT